MLKEIVTAVQAYYLTHRFIIKHRLWKWIFIPGLIYTILFCMGIYLFASSSSHAIDFMMLRSGAAEWIQKMENSWLSWFVIFLQIIIYLVLIMFYFSLFKYLFLIVGAPLFAYLSEKTASIMDGKDYPFSFSQLMKDILRGISIAFRNMFWQTLYAISIFILAFIPVVGWITPLIALLLECYFLGFSMLDFSCERHKLSTTESTAFISKHKGLAIGNGMVFYIMHLVPILGWLLAPSYAVIAATISLYGDKENKLAI